jgi:nitroreductase
VDVDEAVRSRRAVRGFTDQPVADDVLRRVLNAAAWAPWGSNVQPWHVYVVTGSPLVQLKKVAVERVATGDPWDEREYWDCFGAPAALFCYIDRELGRPQWSNLGMYLQTVMLLLRAEGLHSCPQMAWSTYRRTVAEVLSPPDGLILFCGMSIGFEDAAVAYARTGRAPLDETVTFVDDGL